MGRQPLLWAWRFIYGMLTIVLGLEVYYGKLTIVLGLEVYYGELTIVLGLEAYYRMLTIVLGLKVYYEMLTIVVDSLPLQWSMAVGKLRCLFVISPARLLF